MAIIETGDGTTIRTQAQECGRVQPGGLPAYWDACKAHPLLRLGFAQVRDLRAAGGDWDVEARHGQDLRKGDTWVHIASMRRYR